MVKLAVLTGHSPVPSKPISLIYGLAKPMDRLEPHVPTLSKHQQIRSFIMIISAGAGLVLAFELEPNSTGESSHGCVN